MKKISLINTQRNHSYLQVNLFRVYVLLVIFLWLWSIVSATTTLNFQWINMQSIDQKFSDVAFKARWSEFAGSIFWLNAKNIETGETVNIWAETKTCFKQVRWIYYNAQRWNRLRPMDQDTLIYFRWTSNTYDDLNMSGWLYTSCSGDEYSVYGQLTYAVSWDSYRSHITAGTKYNRTDNAISWSFAKSLQRFDNKFPIGYIYDDHWWGIWFIWWKWDASQYAALITSINGWSWINNIFKYGGNNNSTITGGWIEIATTKWNAINTLMNVGVRWTIWLWFSVNTVEKNTILGNFDRKTLIFNALNINFSKLINEVRKNTDNLCKGKYSADTNPDFWSSKKVFCLSGVNVNIDNISYNDRSKLANKTIVLKNWNMQIKWSMKVNEWPVNVFIDRWNLLISNDTWSAVAFDGNGYPVAVWVTKWINLKWNFIVNGLIIWADVVGTSRTKAAFKYKLFFNWKLASLNTPSYPSQLRIDQITNIFGNTSNSDWIRLGKVFKRECDPMSGVGSDLWAPCNNSWDRNALLPLIIVDGNYSFFK